MRHFRFSLKDAPDFFKNEDVFSQEYQQQFSVPFPAIFRFGSERREFAEYYGYVMLLAQFLEFQVVDFIWDLRLWRDMKGLYEKGTKFDRRMTFEDALKELEAIFNMKNKDSRSFISALHKARKKRNALSHRFFNNWDDLGAFLTEEGTIKKLDELKEVEKTFFPVIGVISFLKHGYSLDLDQQLLQLPEDPDVGIHTLNELLEEMEDSPADDESTD